MKISSFFCGFFAEADFTETMSFRKGTPFNAKNPRGGFSIGHSAEQND